jgi:hypothetical protein
MTYCLSITLCGTELWHHVCGNRLSNTNAASVSPNWEGVELSKPRNLEEKYITILLSLFHDEFMREEGYNKQQLCSYPFESFN